MQYVCDAPKGKTWFRIETEGEAAHESRLMSHTVEKYFCREREKAVQSWRPERPNAIERDIGLEAHVQREMPLFLTLRDREGNALATGGWICLPDCCKRPSACRTIQNSARGAGNLWPRRRDT